MAETQNPYALTYGNDTDGRIRFGSIDRKKGVINGVQLENGAPQSTAHYMSMHSTGKFSGGTTNKCPGVYQIECGKDPVNNMGFVLHAIDGDIVIGAPSGRVRIFGQTVDIVAQGYDSKTGNVNIACTNNVFIDGKQIKANGSNSVALVTSGNLYLTSSNNMYLSGAFIKCATGGILGGINGLPRILSNTGPVELIKTVQKLFKDILG